MEIGIFIQAHPYTVFFFLSFLFVYIFVFRRIPLPLDSLPSVVSLSGVFFFTYSPRIPPPACINSRGADICSVLYSQNYEYLRDAGSRLHFTKIRSNKWCFAYEIFFYEYHLSCTVALYVSTFFFTYLPISTLFRVYNSLNGIAISANLTVAYLTRMIWKMCKVPHRTKFNRVTIYGFGYLENFLRIIRFFIRPIGNSDGWGVKGTEIFYTYNIIRINCRFSENNFFRTPYLLPTTFCLRRSQK